MFEKVMLGSDIIHNSHPWSLAYGGHQFGYWAGQLGDGRAISLAQVEYQGNLMELQLKGAGKTPYSRFADGYAVLRSSIREYLAAEHMHALGVPTSRSLALVETNKHVQRETMEKGAIVCRLAPSWIRLGNFELFYARDDKENLKLLADYCIEQFYPGQDYFGLVEQVVLRTADMIARWQVVGFCHGVMNTDNFSILGITIDYGPYQFLDTYDPTYVCNHSDETGRYAFNTQPKMALWNLSRFASALVPLLGEDEATTERIVTLLHQFVPRLQNEYHRLMGYKFGLKECDHVKFEQIIQPFLILLDKAQLDYHLTMRSLTDNVQISEWKRLSQLNAKEWTQVEPELLKWMESYKNEPKDKTLMEQHNPRFVLRNHLVQQVIEEAEKGNYQPLEDYFQVLTKPFDSHPKHAQTYGAPVPKAALGLKCSCSS
ncbi:hypothetical protein EDD86DRAFT_190703 [Gorgonomyces haynaldii]|nr:hypothetical protein EDD86DRAFT_190703 [Gorgonomyces haynaldii]